MNKKIQKLVEKFNSMFPVGSQLQWRSVGYDEFPYETVTVKHPAYAANDRQPVAFFNEKRGYCSIEPQFVNYKVAK